MLLKLENVKGVVIFYAYCSYKNGSLTREKIRDEISLSAISEKWPQVEIKDKHDDSKPTWDVFNQLLDITPRGNFGNIGMCVFFLQSFMKLPSRCSTISIKSKAVKTKLISIISVKIIEND